MLRVRRYGSSGPHVIVLHGGPGARGEAAPLAQGLAGAFRVLEPWQGCRNNFSKCERGGSGEEPLTVTRHIADLHELIAGHADGAKPAIVGHSWGAMLALAYAAAHPESAGPVVLVGCGTFDSAARSRMLQTLDKRMNDDLRQRLARLPQLFPNPAEQMEMKYKWLRPLYHSDELLADPPDEPDFKAYFSADTDSDSGDEPRFDFQAYTETWDDMLRLQHEGVYPAAFSAIRSPVLMLHGTDDPHPGTMIRTGLAPYLPQLEYREFGRCGHYPWRERHAAKEFFSALCAWLARHLRL